MVKSTVVVTRHIRNLRGSSQPFLAEASDGKQYVVKPLSDQIGNQLFNEGVGAELYSAFGYSVPKWKPLLLTDQFIKDSSEEIAKRQGRAHPHSGLAFGSLFLGESNKDLLEVLPGAAWSRVRNRTSFLGSWMIDICAHHTDNRQVIFTRDADRLLNATFIDHGHLLGGVSGNVNPHIMASRYLDPRVYPDVSTCNISAFVTSILEVDTENLWRQSTTLPEEWKTSSAVKAFEDCLHRMHDAKLLQNIADQMLHAMQSGSERQCTQNDSNRGTCAEVLCPFVPNKRRCSVPIDVAFAHRMCLAR